MYMGFIGITYLLAGISSRNKNAHAKAMFWIQI